MTRTPWLLARRHLQAHWIRTGLTVGAMVLALFLFCFLSSIVTTMDRAVRESSANRLIIQSAVSLFVALPLDYQPKVVQVPGVESVSKFQWFGGYYREQGNFFAQFAVDHDVFFDQYARDIEIVEGPGGVTGPEARAAVIQAIGADRRAALIGAGLVRDFGWKVGDTVPITGTIFQKRGGGAWELNVAGVYRPLKSNVDDRTVFFRFDYLDETLAGGEGTGPRGVGTYAVNVAQGHDPAAVVAAIDSIFANGPQKTKTSTEAAFQAGFVSMMGNLPLFVGTIGGAVLFAVFFSVVNTMLLAARQRTQEAGILKALGFPDAVVARLVVAESLLLSLIGGGLGVLFAVASAEPMRRNLGTMLPTYAVTPGTALAGIGIAALIGLVAGVAPAWLVARLKPTEAIRSEG